MAETSLAVKGLRKSFGGVVALDGVDLTLRAGEVTALVGPNGSGKTTLVDCVTGFERSSAGSVWLGSRNLSAASARQRVKAGIRRTFQSARVLPPLSVRDHLMLVQEEDAEYRWLAQVTRSPRIRRDRARHLSTAAAIIDLVGLSSHADVRASQLSYGQQKLLGIACALVSAPTLLCLDEPLAGVSPLLVDVLVEVLDALRASGMTVLVVEHNMDFVHAVADRVVVLAAGRVIADGNPHVLTEDVAVLEALMGA